MKNIIYLVLPIFFLSCTTQYLPSTYGVEDIFVPADIDREEGFSGDIVFEVDHRPKSNSFYNDYTTDHLNGQLGYNIFFFKKNRIQNFTLSITPSVIGGVVIEDEYDSGGKLEGTNYYSTYGAGLQANLILGFRASDKLYFNHGLGYSGGFDGLGTYYEMRDKLDSYQQDPYSAQAYYFIELNTYDKRKELNPFYRLYFGLESYRTLSPLIPRQDNHPSRLSFIYIGAAIGCKINGTYIFLRPKVNTLGGVSITGGVAF